MIGLLNSQLTQVSNSLSTQISKTRTPTKPPHPHHISSPSPSTGFSVATEILTTPWNPALTSWGKRKALSELSNNDINPKQHYIIQVRRSISPPSSDFQNELQHAQINPNTNGRAPFFDPGSPLPESIDSLLSPGTTSPWSEYGDISYEDLVEVAIKVEELEENRIMGEIADVLQAKQRASTTPAKPSPQIDAIDEALRIKLNAVSHQSLTDDS